MAKLEKKLTRLLIISTFGIMGTVCVFCFLCMGHKTNYPKRKTQIYLIINALTVFLFKTIRPKSLLFLYFCVERRKINHSRCFLPARCVYLFNQITVLFML